MKAKIIENNNTKADTNVKEHPEIRIAYFNGDYINYNFMLDVNGRLIIARPCPHPGCKCVGVGYVSAENRSFVEEYRQEIETYIKLFLQETCYGELVI